MTNTKSLPFYFEIFSSIYQLTSLDEPFSAYDVKKHVIKKCPGVNITLKDVKKVVKALYKERDSVFEGFVAQPSYVKKGDEDVKVLFYCPIVEHGNMECCSDDSEVESTVNNYNDDPREYYDSDETKYPECVGCCCYTDKICNSKIGCWLHPTKGEENLKSIAHESFLVNCDGCYYYDNNTCQADKCWQVGHVSSLRKELDDFERDYLCTDKNGKKFYSKPKIEWVDGPKPEIDEEPLGACNCSSCKENNGCNVMKVKFDVEDPDVLVDAFKKVSVKMKPSLLLHDQVKQVREVLKKFVENKKNFSAYELKKEVLKAYQLKATTKAVRKVLDQIFCTAGDILSDYNRSPHYITKGNKRVKVVFYYPGVRGKKLGMNYVVPVLESTVSSDKLKASLIGGEEEVLYSNEEPEYSKELYQRLDHIESANEKLNDLDKVLQKVLSSTKVVWVLNAILKAFDTKNHIKSKLIEVYSDVKGFYS
jgi:hypothetical protein